MARVIDMQLMRYINLFSKVSGVSTNNCFFYNNQIVFAVPKSKVSKAIGKEAVNIKKLRGILRKNIKVVTMPPVESNDGILKFIKEVVDPLEFNDAEFNGDSITINAGRQNKAALIGRNRVREKELSDVLKSYFKILKLKIA